MWDWMQRDVPARNQLATPMRKEGGLHAEQTCRGAVSVMIKAAQKRKYCTYMESILEWKDRDGRNDSSKMGSEEYLKKGKTEKRKKTKDQPPLAPP